MTDGLIAVITALITTMGVKLLERWLPSSDKKIDASAKLRDELWSEVDKLRTLSMQKDKTLDEKNKSMDDKDKEIDEWREQVYAARDAESKSRNELGKVKGQLDQCLEFISSFMQLVRSTDEPANTIVVRIPPIPKVISDYQNNLAQAKLAEK